MAHNVDFFFWYFYSLSASYITLENQSSPEGREMLEFRKSLPAYKEKDAILTTISQNQVLMVLYINISCLFNLLWHANMSFHYKLSWNGILIIINLVAKAAVHYPVQHIYPRGRAKVLWINSISSVVGISGRRG